MLITTFRPDDPTRKGCTRYKPYQDAASLVLVPQSLSVLLGEPLPVLLGEPLPHITQSSTSRIHMMRPLYSVEPFLSSSTAYRPLRNTMWSTSASAQRYLKLNFESSPAASSSFCENASVFQLSSRTPHSPAESGPSPFVKHFVGKISSMASLTKILYKSIL